MDVVRFRCAFEQIESGVSLAEASVYEGLGVWGDETFAGDCVEGAEDFVGFGGGPCFCEKIAA